MKTILLTGSPKFVHQEPRRIPIYMAAIIRRHRFVIIAIICVVILIMYSWLFKRAINFVINSTPVPCIMEHFNEGSRTFDSNEPRFSVVTKITNNINAEQKQHTNFQKLSAKMEISPLEPTMLREERNLYKAEEYTHFIPREEREIFIRKSLGEIQNEFHFPINDMEEYSMSAKSNEEKELFSQPTENIEADEKYVYLEKTRNEQLVPLSVLQKPEEDLPSPNLDNEWSKIENVVFSMSSKTTHSKETSINKHTSLNQQVYSVTKSNSSSTGDNHVLLIDTPGCKIPKLDPWDPSVRDLIELKDPYVCPGIPVFMESNTEGSITVNRSILHMYYNITQEELICYYHPIHRLKEQEGIFREVFYMSGDAVKLDFGIPIKEDFVNVSCIIKGNHYDQLLTLVPLKESLEKERNSLVHPNPALSVLLIGIDSISKLNFLRHFPRTHAFLNEKLKPIEMNGYTKVADNTFPNLVPLLTGQFVEHWWNETLMDTMFFDNVSFIWKEYAKRGYRTFFAEDSPNLGTFNYFKRGFQNPPTDYYYRPMALAVEMRKATSRQTDYYCLDSRLEFDFIFDYLKLFAQTMETRPYFGFTMVSALTHDHLNHAGWADGPTVRLLEGLLNTGALNNTLLVLFSDHGLRFGKICRTYVGKFEERLPLMYIHAPKWFLDQYPEIAKNLKINQDRLMTLFDIHATMLHTLDLSKSKEDRSIITLGKSLYEEISPNRTCADAHIEAHWCPCEEFDIAVLDSPEVINATLAIVDDINSKLQPHGGKCEILEVDTITEARVGKANDLLLKYLRTENHVINKTLFITDGVPTLDDYMITLITKPGGGVFEGTVRHNPYDNSYNVVGVNRISMYGNTSWCIDSPKLKVFCYCKIQKP